jgi:predicted RND superfamily exporter protein
VFVFLVFSFRSLRLAVIAFLPMAVAWVWILGIMQLTGIQFNIVNIILATFIFGQGDDYTIFVLEGALYEKKTGQPMLPQYRQSILLSALIMLISLGVLLVARHPAMHSLGTVTLIGMTCVVLMAWVIPPVLIKYFTSYKSTTYDT